MIGEVGSIEGYYIFINFFLSKRSYWLFNTFLRIDKSLSSILYIISQRVSANFYKCHTKESVARNCSLLRFFFKVLHLVPDPLPEVVLDIALLSQRYSNS
jgi:hypothetical protein